MITLLIDACYWAEEHTDNEDDECHKFDNNGNGDKVEVCKDSSLVKYILNPKIMEPNI